MIYLLLSILCSAAIALLLKWGGKKAKSQEFVLSGNYLSASVVAIVAFAASWGKVVRVSSSTEFVKLLCLGIILGVLLFTAFKLYQKSINEKGVAITGAFAKMGVLIPTVASMFIWREYPSSFQSIGIIIVFLVLSYYYLPRKSDAGKIKFGAILLVLMFTSGLADFMTKIFQKNFEVNQKEIFLFFGFFVALIISLFFAIRDSKFGWKDFGIGISIGIPNVLSTYFLIMALQQLIAAVVFPVYSAGTLIFITLGGMLIFKEQPGKREWITIAGIMIAIIFINI